MSKRDFFKWTAMLLAGPILGVTGVVLYEHDIAKDTVGLIAGIGWITTAIVTAWFAVKVFRALPVRYCVWAMIAAIPLAIVSTLLHGLVAVLTDAEEPFFFILAIFGAPLLLIGGFLGWVLPRGHRPTSTSP